MRLHGLSRHSIKRDRIRRHQQWDHYKGDHVSQWFIKRVVALLVKSSSISISVFWSQIRTISNATRGVENKALCPNEIRLDVNLINCWKGQRVIGRWLIEFNNSLEALVLLNLGRLGGGNGMAVRIVSESESQPFTEREILNSSAIISLSFHLRPSSPLDVLVTLWRSA